ncbi:hypothetical protein [Methanosarcina sp.]|uniref:hypothetical protein n=1 Tax=Methanosarcina sp. TaxID=2213 RepID=UPI002AB93A40|nr:hypothetical protein [Methanosarcina sp.]MDY9925516.1 hypothetical protein [Methanosarcina sp.]
MISRFRKRDPKEIQKGSRRDPKGIQKRSRRDPKEIQNEAIKIDNVYRIKGLKDLQDSLKGLTHNRGKKSILLYLQELKVIEKIRARVYRY